MNKQEELLRKRLIELSSIAFERNIITYTSFLNLNELNIFHNIPKNELFTKYEFYGGFRQAERQMISFIPDAICYENVYPITALSIKPKATKFSQTLNHRDFLGSLLSLGIDRSVVGDILVQEDSAIVFVDDKISLFIQDQLTSIKQTFVEVLEIHEDCDDYMPAFQEVKGTISSIRLDSVLALVLKESRSKLIRYIEGGKVFVNGKITTTNACKLCDDDIISVRGVGKFQYKGVITKTKKDKFYITINKFI